MPDGHKSWSGHTGKKNVLLPAREWTAFVHAELVTSLSRLWDRTNVNLVSVEDIFINVAVVFGCFQTFFAFRKCMKIVSLLVPDVGMFQDTSTSHLGLSVQ
jgi:hypothetical protein